MKLVPSSKLNRRALSVVGAANAALMAALAIVWTGCASSPVDVGDWDRPNIILILTDDQEIRSLPYMESLQRHLVDDGVLFSQAITSFPSCCPSRASILTGQYAHNHGVISNSPPAGGYTRFRELGHEENSLGVLLSRAGYRTALIGKYLNGYPSATWPWPTGETAEWLEYPPGWSYWMGTYDPNDLSGTTYFGYNANLNGTTVNYRVAASDHHTDVTGQEALRFIDLASRQAQPFFLLWSPSAPHEPQTPPVRYAAAFGDVELPKRPSFDEEDVSDKPLWVQQKPRLTPEDVAAIDELFRSHLRHLQAVDDVIDEMVRLLSARKVLDNTWIFYTSDNGFHFGEHRLEPQKSTPYEEDIRVPLVVRGPGARRGAQETALVANIDLLPTILELAQGIPSMADGRSFVPLLVGGSAQTRKVVLIEVWGRFADPWGFGIRGRDYTFVQWRSGEVELYDLLADPYQMDNMAGQTDPAVLARLRSTLEELRACAGEACRLAQRFAPGSLAELRPNP